MIKIDDKLTIICDTREQKELKFRGYSTLTKKLEVGDYAPLGFEDKVTIDRKSLSDLWGTLGEKKQKRLTKLKEASKNYDYLGIYIEGSYTDVLTGNWPNYFRSKMKGYVIIDRLETIKLKYGIDVVFCNDRSEMQKRIKTIFKAYLRGKENKREEMDKKLRKIARLEKKETLTTEEYIELKELKELVIQYESNELPTT